MGPGRDLGGDLLEVPLHGPGVASRQHQGGPGAACRADGAEDVDRLGALVVRGAGPGPATRPAPGDLVLLADPGLVLEPDLYGRAGRELIADLRRRVREVFLNASIAGPFWA